ncbi:DUF4265 domain-containing protein [Umezawaea endophytica]|uniref:DUF4265 domain-containing protein n=1 Tax=Umezawaea endophytica TaxID=1654476 RepID=A0A9X2VG09_9PSEU|nr:DUF4265 domain-containing protein [Umezawaea endophytica]MCS7475925.1 DUF4265 domain-containing protein [Umezawaea endophytica]
MQVAIDGITYVSHEDPVWRRDKNFMALVDLTPYDLDNTLEQLWLQELEEDAGYEVCCIPFYVYGLALGDVVKKSHSDSVESVISKSGRRVLRVLFAEPRPSKDSRFALRDAVEAAGLLSEWNGDHHVAVDVTETSEMQQVFDSVQEEISNQTAFWEWSDSKDFVSP